LRVLEEKQFEPLGALEPETTDARIITAGNRNLKQMVLKGEFREDLYYRINVIEVHLPPLRERMEDIPLLTDHFIRHYNQLRGLHVNGISNDALAALMNYDFPGNIRELQNFIERAFVLCRSGLIRLEHLPEHVRPSTTVSPGAGTTLEEMERSLIINALRRHGGNRDEAARELGIHRSTLYRKIRRYRIESGEYSGGR
jgi:transcriptional regulator with PAS, ATPase and Fis domain